MKKQFILLALAATMIGFTSCNPDDVPTPDPKPDPPNNSNPTAPTPQVDNAFGVMVSIKMDYTQVNSMIPMPIVLKSEIGVATFPVDLGGSTFKDVGAVSVNDIALEKAENHSYYKLATTGMTPSTFEFSGGSVWKNSELGINYTHSVSFPEFKGELPGTIKKADGFSINLSGDITNSPDSIYVLVIANNEYVQKSFAGNATTAEFSSSELQSLATVTDNTAMIQVVPFTITMENIGGKDYAFIKEHAAVKSINIE